MPKQQSSAAPALTYSDVHLILALAEGWPEGAVSLRYDGLSVDAVLVTSHLPPERPADETKLIQIRSSAVGTFKPSSVPGARVVAGKPIGVVDAPGRSTPVVSPQDGKLIALAVDAGDFVEFDQVIASIEPVAGK